MKSKKLTKKNREEYLKYMIRYLLKVKGEATASEMVDHALQNNLFQRNMSVSSYSLGWAARNSRVIKKTQKGGKGRKLYSYSLNEDLLFEA